VQPPPAGRRRTHPIVARVWRRVLGPGEEARSWG
jgi:hypothetical protein